MSSDEGESSDERSVRLTVRSAAKRDAGRGVARLPEAARRELGALSGDTVVLEGERPTVTKAWPAADDTTGVRIDADTRANAGVTVGDTVTVRPTSVVDARSVTVALPPRFGVDDIEAVAADALLDRPVRAGERVHLDRLDCSARIERTDPDTTVRISDATTVAVTTTPTVGDDASPDALDDTRADTTPDGTGPAGTDADAGSDADGDGTPDRRDVAYEDIGGLDEELEQVRELVELPLSDPDRFRRFGVDPPSGVLLHGPPGTGKTLIARAVASEVDATFLTISGPEFVSKYKGESEEQLRETFERARENAPAVVFIDELDAIGAERDDDADMENRVVAQLLTLLDGLEPRGRVAVIGATNRVDTIDSALRRGGRFDREVEVGVPDEAGRREILQVHTRGMPLADDVGIDRIAARTHGFVGADLHSLTTEAAMHALRRRRERRERRETADDMESDEEGDEETSVTRADFEAALAAVDPSAMREHVAEHPDTDFDDVGGLADAKATLREAVEWPLAYGPLFEAAATEPPRGVLLYGPPGTGKTLLARALAGESEVNFVHVAGPELLDRYVGESEQAVREVFDRARQAAPAIVFFDELDAVAGRRGESHEVTERLVSQLLTELDGLAGNPNLVVLAATNRRDALDPALLRPGRFEEHVEVPAPDAETRRAILAVHARERPLADDVDLGGLAAETEGYTGADLAAVFRRASMRAIREVAVGRDPEEANARADEVTITADHLERALERTDSTLGG